MKSKFARKIDLITRITDKSVTKEMMDLFKEYEDEIVEWESLYADLRQSYLELDNENFELKKLKT